MGIRDSDLAQPVDRGVVELAARMRYAVCLFVKPDIVETVVGGKVDNARAAVRKLADEPRPGRLRQRGKHYVAAFKLFRRGVGKGQSDGKARESLFYGLARMRAACRRDELNARMRAQ